MKVSVFGCGYVGLVTAACLAEMGNSVVCADVDADRVARLHQGHIPIHEPGLEPMVRHNATAGRLRFTTAMDEAVDHGTVLFIAVGTPARDDGSVNMAAVEAVARCIGTHMKDHKVIVNKSTVPVGSAERVGAWVEEECHRHQRQARFSVVSNPEFLKEGAAIDDFMHPDRVVIGCTDDSAEWLMKSLYAPFLRNRDRMHTMDPRSAELTKYVANAMLATRISFMNEVALLSEALGADIERVRKGVGSDSRIGPSFLYAGCGWGGSCFPKDVSALVSLGQDHGIELQLSRAAQAVNERQKNTLEQRVVHELGDDLTGRTVAVWGLAFKPDTDDLREAPSLSLVNGLLRRGCTVRAYDPVAIPNAKAHWGDVERLVWCDSALGACSGADALVIVTEWREFRSPDWESMGQSMRQRLVIDGRNLFDLDDMARTGFTYASIGRRLVRPQAAGVVLDTEGARAFDASVRATGLTT